MPPTRTLSFHHPPFPPKKVQFGKLKCITVTSKPLLPECGGWIVLEMACHHFCTVGHTWHLHSKEHWNNSSARYCDTDHPHKWSSIFYPLYTDDWPWCILCRCFVMESRKDEEGCLSCSCCGGRITAHSEIYCPSETSRLNGVYFFIYLYSPHSSPLAIFI